VTVIITAGADPAEMPFSPAVVTQSGSRAIHLSGSTAFPLIHRHPHDENELRVPEGMYDQTVRTLENMRAALEAAGGTITDIVKVVIYNARMQEQDEVNRAYMEFFGDHRPARTHIGVAALVGKGLLIEIDAEAVVSESPTETRTRY
jgi:2-iminobutanoate/2-iminopropanoate deaminase